MAISTLPGLPPSSRVRAATALGTALTASSMFSFNAPVQPSEDFLLLETGDFLLLETGDKVVLE